MPPNLSARAATWLGTLLAYLSYLPEHVERLQSIIETDRVSGSS